MKKSLLLLTLMFFAVSLSAATITKTEFAGKNISGITATGDFEIELIKSHETKVVVEIDESIKDALILDLSKGIVTAGFKQESAPKKGNKIKLTIYLPVVNELNLADNASLTMDKTDIFAVNGNVKIKLSGTSSLDYIGLQAKRVNLKMEDASKAKVNMEAKTIDVSISNAAALIIISTGSDYAKFHTNGTSKVNISGDSKSTHIDAYGNSIFCGYDYLSINTSIISEGAALIETSVKESLDALAKDKSIVKYKGEPKIKKIKYVSAAAIIKIEE